MRSSTYKILAWVGAIIFLGFAFYAFETKSHYNLNFPETVVNFAADDVTGGKSDYASENGNTYCFDRLLVPIVPSGAPHSQAVQRRIRPEGP